MRLGLGSTTHEAETHPVVREKILRANSSDTLRSRATTGKPARQLRTAWTNEWESPPSRPLRMPLHTALVAEPQARVKRAAAPPGSRAERLITYFVGQIVGTMDTSLLDHPGRPGHGRGVPRGRPAFFFFFF